MRKFIIMLAALVVLPFALSACGPVDSSAKAADVQTLNGTWKADGFEAVVTDNNIEVNIVEGDTSSLYWKGTFPADSDKVVSQADTEALSQSMLGSQDSTKEFTVKGDQIDFKITIMGTSKVVHLKKA